MFQAINPATGQPSEAIPHLTDEELERLIDRAQRAFQAWLTQPIDQRAEVLHKAADIMRYGTDEYAAIITREMGKRILEARFEIGLSASILDYYARNAAEFLRSSPLPEVENAELRFEPLGIILAIEPWNFPFYQVARVAGPQLAAGNVLLVKHADIVPECALLLADIFRRAGAPDGVYTNLFASIPQIEAIIGDDRVRGVTLTGSEQAGAAVAELAGRHLKKSVLELGGSDPMIILEDAPLVWAVQSAIFGRLINTGQCCVGTKRVIVIGQERGAQILAAITNAFAGLTVGDPLVPETQVGPLASQRALDTCLAQIAEARASGATVSVGGGRCNRDGFYLEPTVLSDIPPGAPISRQELFGPVVMVYIVNSVEEAVALANNIPYGLGASVLTADEDRGRLIAARIDAGMVFVNQPSRTQAELPFGGVKNSGYGRELSRIGITEFVNQKVVTWVPAGTPLFGSK